MCNWSSSNKKKFPIHSFLPRKSFFHSSSFAMVQQVCELSRKLISGSFLLFDFLPEQIQWFLIYWLFVLHHLPEFKLSHQECFQLVSYGYGHRFKYAVRRLKGDTMLQWELNLGSVATVDQMLVMKPYLILIDFCKLQVESTQFKF